MLLAWYWALPCPHSLGTAGLKGISLTPDVALVLLSVINNLTAEDIFRDGQF
jgi:hypothetical protein